MIRTSIAAVLSCAAAMQAVAQGNGFEPVTRDMLINPPPGDWLMPVRGHNAIYVFALPAAR